MLVVYNTCELRQNNLFWYIDCLNNLLNQDYDNFNIVVSGCALTNATKQGLQKRFGNRIWYNFIDETYIVNMTFNKTITEVVNRVGEYDGYLYIDSGINTLENTNCLQEINNRAITDKYGIITLQTDDDNGHDWWFGTPKNYIFKDKDFLIPVGKCCNLHVNYWDNRIYKCYKKLIPDIFVAYCVESVFSFFPSSLNLQWVIVKDITLHHLKSLDGASFSVDHNGPKGAANNLFCNLDINDIINCPLAKKVGFGYNEAGLILNQLYRIHDESKFTVEGYSKNSEKLIEFLKEYMFLKPNQFNYDNIKYKLIL